MSKEKIIGYALMVYALSEEWTIYFLKKEDAELKIKEILDKGFTVNGKTILSTAIGSHEILRKQLEDFAKLDRLIYENKYETYADYKKASDDKKIIGYKARAYVLRTVYYKEKFFGKRVGHSSQDKYIIFSDTKENVNVALKKRIQWLEYDAEDVELGKENTIERYETVPIYLSNFCKLNEWS